MLLLLIKYIFSFEFNNIEFALSILINEKKSIILNLAIFYIIFKVKVILNLFAILIYDLFIGIVLNQLFKNHLLYFHEFFAI